MKYIVLISLFLAHVHSTPECVSKVEKAKCDMVQGQCWCYVGEGILPSSVCGYPDGYSGEYYSIADALPWTIEISPWTILTRFGKVPWQPKCGYGGCKSDGLHNACYAYRGCTGTSLAPHFSNKDRWERRSGGHGGDGTFVRCKDIEDGIQSCNDGLQNNDETGIDCGGSCVACPSCNDGLQNQNELGIDCGGECTACPRCNDGIQNQDETGIDSGGFCSTCPTCNDGKQKQDGEDEDNTDGPTEKQCQKFIDEALAKETVCLEENTRYLGANIPKKSLKKNVQSAEECQEKCQENPECLFFTWNSDKNQCALKQEKGKARSNCGKQCTGKISGPKNC